MGFIVLLAVCAMAVAEETVDQSADEQFFHTYGYYPTAYHYTAPVAVKTVKYAPLPSNTWLPPSKPSNMLLLTPTNTELILTLPLTSHTPSNLFCPLPTALILMVLILMVLILMVPTHTVTPSPLKKRRKKNRFPQLFQSYTRSTTSRIF